MIEPGKHKMSEAMKGETPVSIDEQDQRADTPGAPHDVVAEQTRRQQESQHNGKNDLDRDNHLTQIGRGQQTHG